jgi:hypothetical protein
MAKINLNSILSGVKGKLGNLIFRQVGKRTIIQTMPGKSKRKRSPAQKAHNERFEGAIRYAREATGDGAPTKADYQARADGMKTAYSVAIGDFMHAPEILGIDVSRYHGRKGDVIRARCLDDFQVAEVYVCILSAPEVVLEDGQALRSDNGIDWCYETQQDYAEVANLMIRVAARDKAGNLTMKEHRMNEGQTNRA